MVVEAIARTPRRAAAELVGLAPEAAFDGFPAILPVRTTRLIEDALAKANTRDHTFGSSATASA